MSLAQYQHQLLLTPVKKNYILYTTFLYINCVTMCLVLDSKGLHHFLNFHKYNQIKPTTQLLQLITIKLTVIIRISTNIHTNIFIMFISLFHRAFRFTKVYLYQRMHLFLSYTKITFYK